VPVSQETALEAVQPPLASYSLPIIFKATSGRVANISGGQSIARVARGWQRRKWGCPTSRAFREVGRDAAVSITACRASRPATKDPLLVASLLSSLTF